VGASLFLTNPFECGAWGTGSPALRIKNPGPYSPVMNRGLAGRPVSGQRLALEASWSWSRAIGPDGI
jgi:hypothetical protein